MSAALMAGEVQAGAPLVVPLTLPPELLLVLTPALQVGGEYEALPACSQRLLRACLSSLGRAEPPPPPP